MSKILNKILISSITNHIKNKTPFAYISAQRFSESGSEKAENEKLGGFAKAFEKYTAPQVEPVVEDRQTFASLLRESKFIDVNILCEQ